MHVWINKDFGGTRGWFQCERCGHKQHFPQPEGPVTAPAADLKVYSPDCEPGKFYTGVDSTCTEIVLAKARIMAGKLRKKERPEVLAELAKLLSGGN
jgi:hypothetical protein